MRILHTADWHIGKSLRGRSRMDEHESALAEVADIAVREQIDLVIIAGDLFDSHAPAADCERLVFEFLAKLIGHRIQTVIIGGNHDHPKRLDALKPLLKHLAVHVFPEVRAPRDGGVVELAVKGSRAVIAAVPFVPEHKLLNASLMMGEAVQRFTEYSDRMAAMIDVLCEGFATDAVNIIAGHLYVLGAESSGSERAVHLSRPYALPAQRFPTSASYIALGHLHRPQEIAAASPAYYSGSLLQLDFGEVDQRKRVVMVDAAPGRPSRIESIPIECGRKLRKVFGTLADLKNRVAHSDGELLQVTVEAKRRTPGIADEVREFLPNALDIQLSIEASEVEARPAAAVMTPAERFAHFHRTDYGEPAAELLAAFERLFEEASHASHSS